MDAFGSLGIDIYSLAIYIVNFGVIVFLVSKYLSGPIITMLEKRSSLIKGNLSEADELKEEMILQRQQMEAEHVKARALMNEEIHKLKVDLEKKRKQSEQEIESKRTEMLSQLNKSMEEQKDKIRTELKKDISITVQNMISHIVSNKIPEDILKESVEEAWSIYKR